MESGQQDSADPNLLRRDKTDDGLSASINKLVPCKVPNCIECREKVTSKSESSLSSIPSSLGVISCEYQYNVFLLRACENNDCNVANNRSAFIAAHLMDDDFGPSSCGAVAVWAALCMLGFDNFDKHRLAQVIGIHKRAETAPLPTYLLSRANAGCTAADLLNATCKLSHQCVGGRFFHSWPTRRFSLHRFLSFWIRCGAVPVLTLNLQKRSPNDSSPIADAWHHDVVFAISHSGISGPLIHTITCPTGFRESVISSQLDSDSFLLIRRADVVSRFHPSSSATGGAAGDEHDLRRLCDTLPGWDTSNVLGQVVNIMREETFRHLGSLTVGGDPYVTTHLSIPASYKAGITLFAWRNSSVMDLIMKVPELPLAQ